METGSEESSSSYETESNCFGTEKSTSFLSRDKGWVSRNVYGVSVSMVMVFTAFVGLQNLQSTINSDDGLGVISLSVLYGMFALVSPLTPIILRIFGTKYALLIGYVCHLIYTLTNFVPSWYTLIPSSVILGLASAPIWAAVGSHFAEIAIIASSTFKQEQSHLISEFTAIFFFVFQFSQLPGNIVSSLTLFPYNNNTTPNLSCIYLEDSPTEVPTLFYALVAAYTIFISIGIGILLFTVSKVKMVRHYNETESDSWLVMYVKLPMLELLNVISNWRMIMLLPMALYIGLEMGFSYGTFTKVSHKSLNFPISLLTSSRFISQNALAPIMLDSLL